MGVHNFHSIATVAAIFHSILVTAPKMAYIQAYSVLTIEMILCRVEKYIWKSVNATVVSIGSSKDFRKYVIFDGSTSKKKNN